ncbi:MAG TPA: HAMP domain-containing sensor histidine kinase [Candidatus Nanoarchaeia archaeon]|nr:HAMP domain-containing sensor histidine kinase [Candidatus Nanoarchaeia archaeon]
MKSKELSVTTDPQLEEFLALVELGKQARVIFHDLANHFTTLNLTIRELEQNLTDERRRFQEYTKRSNETRAQVEYVANLLRSHITGGQEPYYLDKVIREIIGLFESKQRKLGIQTRIRVRKGVRWTQHKRDFIHIVTNLIGNAIESFETITDTRQRIIHVELLEQNSSVILIVKDTGCGIPHNQKVLMGKAGFTTKKHGNGIGFAAAKEQVEKTFGGNITISSSTLGSCFKVKLFEPKQNRKRSTLPVLSHLLTNRLLSDSIKDL